MTAITSEMVDENTIVSAVARPWLANGGSPVVSVLVPAKDEAENLPLFMQQARAAFAGRKEKYEVVVIDDGSVDGTWETLESLVGRYPFLRAVRHRAGQGNR